MKKPELKFDEIGYWSEIKLDIVKEYAKKYSEILTAQKRPQLHHVYIDAFAGPGLHISKTSKSFVLGSPLNALLLSPPFREYFLIDTNHKKVEFLKGQVGTRNDVHIFEGDCNRVLLDAVFPNVLYEDFRRGLCLLDPYGLHLNWKVIETAGQMRTLELFLNFPVADINRKVLWRNPEGVSESDIKRMNTYWGDESWRQIAYTTQRNLFGIPEKEDNETIAEAFRQRLIKVARFKHVPEPLPMRNNSGTIVYYLFFVSQNTVGNTIIQHIFKKYEKRGTK